MSTFNQTKEEIREELLMIGKAKADPDCFEWLYDKYYRNIFRFVYKRCGNKEVTSDITSGVFLKAMINLPKYEFKGVPFSAWLYRIAVNEVNFWFRKSRSSRTISIDQTEIKNVLGELDEDDNEDINHLLFDALSRLPEEMMQIIELRFFENRPFKEVGMILGITENNAKVKVYRVLYRLKKIMQKKRNQ